MGFAAAPYRFWPATLRAKALCRGLRTPGLIRSAGKGRPATRATALRVRSTLPVAGAMLAWENELLLPLVEVALNEAEGGDHR